VSRAIPTWWSNRPGGSFGAILKAAARFKVATRIPCACGLRRCRRPTPPEWEAVPSTRRGVGAAAPWGLERARVPGHGAPPRRPHLANTWQGEFRHPNTRHGRYSAPLFRWGCFPPTLWLLDCIGNVGNGPTTGTRPRPPTPSGQRHGMRPSPGCCTIPNPRGGSREAQPSIPPPSTWPAPQGVKWLLSLRPQLLAPLPPGGAHGRGIDTSTANMGFPLHRAELNRLKQAVSPSGFDGLAVALRPAA